MSCSSRSIKPASRRTGFSELEGRHEDPLLPSADEGPYSVGA